MAAASNNKILTLDAYCSNILNDSEFVLLYDINSSSNLCLPYWRYDRFNIEDMNDDECKSEFRFLKDDIYTLKEIMNIPDVFTCYNGLKVSGIESLCILLKRYAYPNRYSDLIPRFGRPVPQLCIIANHTMNFVYDNWNYLLHSFNQQWLSPDHLQKYANYIHQTGAPLDNCWGFVDGTVRPVCRPKEGQRELYNGHKRVHAIKFQSIIAPNGMIANLYGPVMGRRHDAYMLAASGVLNELEQHSFEPTGNSLCIYRDPAYPLRIHLQTPFRGANITPIQHSWNKAMSSARVSAEWVFGDILNFYKFLDFQKNLKIKLSAVGKMYILCALLHNARCCFYGSVTENYFGIEPPLIREYFT